MLLRRVPRNQRCRRGGSTAPAFAEVAPVRPQRAISPAPIDRRRYLGFDAGPLESSASMASRSNWMVAPI